MHEACCHEVNSAVSDNLLYSHAQGVGRAFSEKFQSGGIIGALGADTAALGALTVANASLGLVTQASVNLTEAPCAGVLVRVAPAHPCPLHV
jgi:hypothetical protein